MAISERTYINTGEMMQSKYDPAVAEKWVRAHPDMWLYSSGLANETLGQKMTFEVFRRLGSGEFLIEKEIRLTKNAALTVVSSDSCMYRHPLFSVGGIGQLLNSHPDALLLQNPGMEQLWRLLTILWSCDFGYVVLCDAERKYMAIAHGGKIIAEEVSELPIAPAHSFPLVFGFSDSAVVDEQSFNSTMRSILVSMRRYNKQGEQQERLWRLKPSTTTIAVLSHSPPTKKDGA